MYRCLRRSVHGPVGAQPDPPIATRQLTESPTRWPQEVNVTISAEVLAAFAALTRDYERDAFSERFRRECETGTRTGCNESHADR